MNEKKITKGYLAEEVVRNYFLETEAYVLRDVKLTIENEELSDMDLWLYLKPSPFARMRINVDIKDKDRPKAMERIVWAKGIKESFDFEQAIVVTSSKRENIHEFGKKTGVSIIDGISLELLKQKYSKLETRFTEEDFNGNLDPILVKIKEASKQLLIRDSNFDVLNQLLEDLKTIILKKVNNGNEKEWVCRLFYFQLSLILLCVDNLFVKNHLKFPLSRIKESFEEGVLYGETAKTVLDETKRQFGDIPAVRLRLKEFETSISEINFKVLSEHFLKSDVQNSLFRDAKVLESYAFNKAFVTPEKLEPYIKSHFAVLLDFHRLDRKKFMY